MDVITSALSLLNILSSGEMPSGAEANDALRVLHDMWDSWNAERLMIYTIPRLVFTLNAGGGSGPNGSYTYGLNPGGAPADFNAPRPAYIDRMGIINLNNPSQPLELPLQYLTVAQWQEVPVKNITSALPQYCWDDQAFPLRNLTFWPVANIGLQVAIYPWAALNEPITLNTLMAFPPGYAKAFRYNLAVDLGAEFQCPAQTLATVAAIAAESKGIVKRMNIPILDLQCDRALTTGSDYLYNWISDMPAGR
jgi:hypothetical protein